mmetsp:Transcript_83690/g.194642  ORF Transcript_83690/g.194642 Transcript_83690/m.194642 type:complete len:293 (+) Transcript_83690:45-923(+)
MDAQVLIAVAVTLLVLLVTAVLWSQRTGDGKQNLGDNQTPAAEPTGGAPESKTAEPSLAEPVAASAGKADTDSSPTESPSTAVRRRPSRQDLKLGAEAAFEAEARRVFDACDRNGDGKLSAADLMYAMRDSFVRRTLKLRRYDQCRTIIKDADTDNSGLIDFNEFKAYLARKDREADDLSEKRARTSIKERNISTSAIEAAFRDMDSNGDGALQGWELKRAYEVLLKRTGKKMDETRVIGWVNNAFRKYDTDNSEALDLPEFTKLVLQSGAFSEIFEGEEDPAQTQEEEVAD